jgi:hypothetical protein
MKAYTFHDWREAHKGQSLLCVSLGDWHEFKTRPRLGRIFRWRGQLPELWYYVKCRLWRRYNTVTATTMPPTWQDADERLLHISFAILCDVVEGEDILHHCAWTEQEHMGADHPQTPIEPQYTSLQEIATLYDWWKNVRPQRLEPTEWWSEQCKKEGIPVGFDFEPAEPGLSQMQSRGTTDQQARSREILRQSGDMEDQQTEEDDEMLCRLIRVRHALWT